MMPPEQEPNSISKGSATTNVSDNISVQIELPASTSNVSPCPYDEMPDKNHATLVRSSFLRESSCPITLTLEDVSYKIKLQNSRGINNFWSSTQPKLTRTILNNVSGIVKPGELLAMLGPSGSGKTTLLTALAGRLPGKISGTILYNGQPFSSSIKRKTGFVTQDDVLYPHLTVLETLTYAALLKLPKTLTRKEKMEQAELIIVELGLTRCRNTIIGGPLLRGISGGERKRVSIGHEMLVNPSVLLVDEPTSGLDSTTAQRIMATLRRVAHGGRTVVATVHQPSSRLFRMFDKVIVLSEGCPIYSGGANGVMDYFASIGCVPGFNFMNPADFLLDLANGTGGAKVASEMARLSMLPGDKAKLITMPFTRLEDTIHRALAEASLAAHSLSLNLSYLNHENTEVRKSYETALAEIGEARNLRTEAEAVIQEQEQLRRELAELKEAYNGKNEENQALKQDLEAAKAEAAQNYEVGHMDGRDAFRRSEEYQQTIEEARFNGARDFRHSTVFQMLALEPAADYLFDGFVRAVDYMEKEGFTVPGFDPVAFEKYVTEPPLRPSIASSSVEYREFPEFQTLGPVDSDEEDNRAAAPENDNTAAPAAAEN